ncbi:hypothetical protein NDU88_002453 [Pleurodeles waltl]|uniref:Uncharacterized protein n=1 Tax=Pleurodeles waltl TaxID=8319 RepID=A0AAV7LE55_PLEWA|nr:hypothetical protein NDU88_002453 [Pleurodeles waltl]
MGLCFSRVCTRTCLPLRFPLRPLLLVITLSRLPYHDAAIIPTPAQVSSRLLAQQGQAIHHGLVASVHPSQSNNPRRCFRTPHTPIPGGRQVSPICVSPGATVPILVWHGQWGRAPPVDDCVAHVTLLQPVSGSSLSGLSCFSFFLLFQLRGPSVSRGLAKPPIFRTALQHITGQHSPARPYLDPWGPALLSTHLLAPRTGSLGFPCTVPACSCKRLASPLFPQRFWTLLVGHRVTRTASVSLVSLGGLVYLRSGAPRHLRPRSPRRVPGHRRPSSPPLPGSSLGRLRWAPLLPTWLSVPRPPLSAWAAPRSGFK